MPSAGIDPAPNENATELPPLEWVDGEPQFRLFVAGPSGAGKTVFLASLYNQLLAAGNSSQFYVRLASREQDIDLREKYDTIRYSEDWPMGNVVSSEYVFKCFHASK